MSNQISNIVTSSHIIGINDETTCNARDLHTRLSVSRDFLTWIKSRVDEYDFKDGFDFIIVNGEYHVTSDMAKGLAMLENTQIGKMVRLGFIAAERELRQLQKTRLQESQAKVALLGSDNYPNQFEESQYLIEELRRQLHEKNVRIFDLEGRLACYEGRGKKDAWYRRVEALEIEVRALKSALLNQEDVINQQKMLISRYESKFGSLS